MINEKTAKRFCCEDISLIQNYDKAVADKTQTWICHHRNGINRDLKAEYLYFKRPASELIFMTRKEHSSLHHKNFKYSDEAKEKLRQAALGNKRALGYKHTPEQRKHNSEAKSGSKHPFYGMHWYNNGVDSVRAHECPDGYVEGRLCKRTKI